MSQKDTLQLSYGNHRRIKSKQAVQTPGGKGIQDKEESIHYPIHRRTEPDRAYYDYFRLTRSKTTKLPSGFTLFRNKKISDQELPFLTSPGTFQVETRINGEKQDFFQPEAERVRPYDPEAVELVERSTQEP
ncbi:hypothetical protein O181_050115 [Austropuccinia psidii MF-1]|uniref:Uncharacterized protein n=1 Tax=Austropuccinia psidii MF-1 TaxID=1389203 RepID=A0A9Q3HQN1_9BASI|nr:hypothetical protein [Austropuccinia psidii MF-1]